VSTVTSSLLLPGSGFQRRTFRFLWVPVVSACLSYQLLTCHSCSCQLADCLQTDSQICLHAHWLTDQSRSQSYFTTGGLPPISSSRRQAYRGSRPDFVFATESFRQLVLSLYIYISIYLSSLGTDRADKTASNSSIAAWTRCLAIDLVLLRAYEAVA
jgi:hypothetical protein